MPRRSYSWFDFQGDKLEMSEKKRPTVVKILVLIVIIASIIPILAGVMALTGGAAYEGYFMQELLSQILPTYYVLVGVIGLVVAWGLWIGRGWAWIIALIIFIIGIIMDLVTLPTGIVGVVIDAIVLYLLMRPDTRKFCGK
jgi:ABC-type multidrug transport system permease subunit